MQNNIEVIPYIFKEDVYDENFKLIYKKGFSVVSHGFDHKNLKHVILPEEPYHEFVLEHCIRICDKYYLK